MVFSGVCIQGSNVGRHVQVAREAERLGYKSGWVTEVAGPDAVTVLAACAAATSKLTLGTGILPIFVRDPFLAALTFHSLADLADRPVVAGFGTSTPAIVTGWHGLPFDRPVAHTRAYVEIVRKLLAGERVKSEGLYTIRGAQLRGPAKHPVKIYLAALNTRMLELAGEVADGVILNFPTPGYTTRAIEAISRGLAKGGRQRSEIEIVANFRTGVSEDFDAIANVLRRELITYFMAPVYQQVFREDGYAGDVERVTALWAAGDRPGAIAAIPDAFAGDHSVIGSVEAGRAKVQRFLDLGIDRAVLFPVVPDARDGVDRFVETMAAFA